MDRVALFVIMVLLDQLYILGDHLPFLVLLHYFNDDITAPNISFHAHLYLLVLLARSILWSRWLLDLLLLALFLLMLQSLLIHHVHGWLEIFVRRIFFFLWGLSYDYVRWLTQLKCGFLYQLLSVCPEYNLVFLAFLRRSTLRYFSGPTSFAIGLGFFIFVI